MKDNGEFFKNLLDDQKADAQQKKDNIVWKLPRFSDTLTAWNFRSVIQEMGKDIKHKPNHTD